MDPMLPSVAIMSFLIKSLKVIWIVGLGCWFYVSGRVLVRGGISTLKGRMIYIRLTPITRAT
jgi:hypothetical protein